jgi:hypothetical protein
MWKRSKIVMDVNNFHATNSDDRKNLLWKTFRIGRGAKRQMSLMWKNKL